MKIDVPDLIQRLPLPIMTRMKLERLFILFAKLIKRLHDKEGNKSVYYPLVRNNRFYGNEYQLRKYCGYSKPIIAIIEHGLYFGNNTQKVGLKHEWELGTILTYGDYRKELIKKAFPNYYCETIGPMIHYASIDHQFMENIKRQLRKNTKTMLFFPVHGNELFSPEYDFEMTIKKIDDIASQYHCGNVIICVYHLKLNTFEEITNKTPLCNNFIITTNGNRYDEAFLDRQKTLISLSDYTISNNLGTHLGYCIYLGKPHFLLAQDFSYKGDAKAIADDFGNSNRSDNYYSDFDKEKELFQKVFNLEVTKITEEQYKLCDYYWGFSKVKTPEELRIIIEKCKDESKKFRKSIYI